MTENMADIIRKHRCRWLGHLARMDNSRLPKQLLFGELIKTRSRHGPKRRWRDLVVMDIKTFGIGDWYEIAQDRQQWTTVCKWICASAGVGEVCIANTSLIRSFTCTCECSFKCSGDLTRHQHFCGTQHPDHVNLEPPTFYCSCGRSFHRGRSYQAFAFLQSNIILATVLHTA